MPIFEYECGACRHVFERLLRGREEQGNPDCPACGSRRVRKLLSVFGGKIGNTSSGGGCGTCTATSCSPS